METRDIQLELVQLVKGMNVNNIYSQLTYFLVLLASQKSNPRTHAHELSMIIGLISDTYLGLVATDQVQETK